MRFVFIQVCKIKKIIKDQTVSRTICRKDILYSLLQIQLVRIFPCPSDKALFHRNTFFPISLADVSQLYSVVIISGV